MPSPPRSSEIPKHLTPDAFWSLFGRIEHEQLDFKRGVPQDVLETIPAMAMTEGGVIVCGVNDQREITGCLLSQNTLDRIKRFANECDVAVEVRQVEVGETSVVLVDVPRIEGRIVTTPNGRLLRRVGGDCQPLRGDALMRFVQAQSQRPAEDEALSSPDPSDFDLETINKVLEAAGRPPASEDRILAALADLKLTRPATPAGNPVRAAAVLFARDPRKFLPRAAVQLVRRAGRKGLGGTVLARDECSGPLVTTLRCCMRFIAGNTRRFEAVIGTRREALSEYPESVLREAIVNALAHRDYGLVGATVDITVRDDHLTIRSPGPLPGHITLENMRTEHFSRNPKIMAVLKTLRLVEEFGDGVDRMFAEMASRLMRPPEFDANADSVTVTLRSGSRVPVEDQAWLRQLADFDLAAEHRLLLATVRRRGDITRREASNLLPEARVAGSSGYGYGEGSGSGASPEARVARSLQEAVDRGLLERIGKRGGVRYVLSPAVIFRAGGGAAPMGWEQRLLREIRERGSLSTAEASVLLEIPRSSARRRLNQLASSGEVLARGRTRARRYYALPTTAPPENEDG